MNNPQSNFTDARAFHFVNQTGAAVNSTEFAKSVLSQAVAAHEPELARRINAESNWRGGYQAYFKELAALEFADRNQGFDIANLALSKLGTQIVDQTGDSLQALAQQGFASRNLVQTFRIRGAGAPEGYWPGGAMVDAATGWVARGLAEPDVAKAFDFLEQSPALPIASDLLIALAGNAELAATRDWLSLGGRVAVVARPNRTAWHSLIEHARSSAGELLVCVDARNELPSAATDEQIAAVAGLNLVDDIDLVASWVHALSRTEDRVVLASYSYVGGSKQIVAQAAQDSIIEVASSNIARAKLALSYLATPLDVVSCNAEIANKQFAAFDLRGKLEKWRDAFLKPFSMLIPADPKTVDAKTGNFAIFDASSSRQGSSYLLAKHSEKLRAIVAARRGNLVSFTVAPPARTHSVLDTKILEKTYRGLPSLGVEPFTAAETRRAMALLLLRNLHDENSPAAPANSISDPIAMVSATAIHGGIWRLGYRPESIWVFATLLGLLPFSTRRNRH